MTKKTNKDSREKSDSKIKSRVSSLLRALQKLYPDARCALWYRNPFELLVATILSAQTNDLQVNKVTPQLFARYPDPETMAQAPVEEVAQCIRSINYFQTKAKNIVGASRLLVERYQGQVPLTVEELTTLPGVGRKTANVIIGEITQKAQGIVVDTHVKRVSYRLGLTSHQDPVKIEHDLMKIIPRRYWVVLAHWLIHHGRQVCLARHPRCHECGLRRWCLRSLSA